MVGFAYTYAADYAGNTPPMPDLQSQLIVPPVTSYEGSVYTPFDNTAPSEQSSVAPRNNAPAGRRKGFITPGDINQGTESPIGEPWILLAFATIGAGAIAIKNYCKQHIH